MDFWENAKMMSKHGLLLSRSISWGILEGTILGGYSFELWEKCDRNALLDYACAIEKEAIRRGRTSNKSEEILYQKRVYSLPKEWVNPCLINSHRMMHIRLYPMESEMLGMISNALYDGALFYHRDRGLFNPYSGIYTQLAESMIAPRYCCFQPNANKMDERYSSKDRCGQLVTNPDGPSVCSMHDYLLRTTGFCKCKENGTEICGVRIPLGLNYCDIHDDWMYGTTIDEISVADDITVVETEEEFTVTIKKRKKGTSLRSLLPSCFQATE
jgi:hypothetical protein